MLNECAPTFVLLAVWTCLFVKNQLTVMDIYLTGVKLRLINS